MSSRAVISIILSAVLIFSIGCSHKIPDPASPVVIDDVVPPTPENLRITVGDESLSLSWSIAGDSSLYTYRIYLAVFDSTMIDYDLIAESDSLHTDVSGMQNGRLVFVKVSAVNGLGFEGYRSDSISAMPDYFSLLVDGDHEYTGSRDVTLSLAASEETGLMIISEDSTFAGTQWENFQPAREFELSGGDGVKTVFARFRDVHGGQISGYLKDSIILDTRAVIDSVGFTPAGVPLSPGDIVHFRVLPNETDGNASVTIGDDIVTISLYDDGLRGDAVADDGIYETDYTIDADLDFESRTVYGNFIDRAGNVAREVSAQEFLTVRRAPDPVNIYSVYPPDGYYDRLQLFWSASDADDFAQYRIYRGLSTGVDSTDFLAAIITSRTTASVTDTGLSENTMYFYRVFVIDNTGLWTGSAEANGSTTQDLPPAPITFNPVVVLPDFYQDIGLEWSASTDNDFGSYRLFRWREDLGRADSVSIAVIGSREVTSFNDSPPFDIPADTVNYWYIIHVYDVGGNSTPSDSIRIHLVDEVPPIVSGTVEPSTGSIFISWNSPNIPDFSSYHLLRDTDSDPAGAITVFISSDQVETSYDDTNTSEGQIYFYWLDIYDNRSNVSQSSLGSGSW